MKIARKIGEVQAEPAGRADKHYASVAVGSGNRGKRAETTHDPKDVVPFVASSCRNVTPSSNSTNGPYRTRTVGDESNLEIARTQIEALLSLASVADDEQLQRLVSIWNKLDDATKEVILRVAEAGEK